MSTFEKLRLSRNEAGLRLFFNSFCQLFPLENMSKSPINEFSQEEEALRTQERSIFEQAISPVRSSSNDRPSLRSSP